MLCRKRFLLVVGCLLLSSLVFIVSPISHGFTAPSNQEPSTPAPATEPTPQPDSQIPPLTSTPNLSIADEVCLGCHGEPGQTMTLANGETLDLYVPAELHQNSIHGKLGYACVQCHRDVGDYPHPEFTAQDRRAVTLQLNQTCDNCHSHQYDLSQDSVHAKALKAGEREAAVCSDCHTAHEVRRLNDPDTGELLSDAKTWIPERCALCHSTIYEEYRESVHGAALSEGSTDVPTCIDCHGVHNIQDPRTSSFRLQSPKICAECHSNPTITSKYGLSTDVLQTYVADFHGTTVAIFEKQSPDSVVNQAVCYDCHGVHNISRTDDPETGLAMKENILKRCQLCHPDATANFPTAWMSHYNPSPAHYPLVYYVNLFYKIFIPVVLGGMALLVVLDSSRRLINRRRWMHETTLEGEQTELEVESEGIKLEETITSESEQVSSVDLNVDITFENPETGESIAKSEDNMPSEEYLDDNSHKQPEVDESEGSDPQTSENSTNISEEQHE